MKMVVARVSGGLGNQLFQIAFAQRKAFDLGVGLLVDGSSGFKNDPYNRKFALSFLGIPSAFESLNQFSSVQSIAFKVFIGSRFLKIARIFPLGRFFDLIWQKNSFSEIVESKALINVFNVTVVVGYFQSYEWCKNLSVDILEIGKEKVPNLSSLKRGKGYAAVHIRFFEDALSPVISSYLDLCVGMLETDDSVEVCLVVSENKASAEVEIGRRSVHHKFVFQSSQLEVDDLYALAGADKLFLADSTFSLWAGYLCYNAGGQVHYPKFVRKSGASFWGMPGSIPESWRGL